MSSFRDARGLALAALAVVAPACGDASGPTVPLTVEIFLPAAGDTVLRFDTLALRASVRDGAGREVEYEAVDWFIGTGRVLGHGASTSGVVGDTGEVLVTARAGLATSSVTLTVLSNSPPTVTLLAAPPARFYIIDTVTMVARAQDAETAAQVFWYSDRGGFLGVGDTLRWNPASTGGAGFHILRIEARDPQGNRDVAVATANVLPGERFKWTAGVCAPGVGGAVDAVVLALGDDGRLFLGGGSGGPCYDTLRAVSSTGSALWTHPVQLWEHTSGVTIAPDGRAFVLDYFGTVRGLDTEGNLLWARQVLSQDSHGRLALSPEGALYAGGLGDALVRLDPETGTELWTIGQWQYNCGPSVGADRSVIAQVAGRTELYTAEGALVRSITQPGWFTLADCLAAMDWAGVAYIAVRTGAMAYAVTAQGQQLWSVSLGSGQVGEPVIDAQGTAYVAVGRGGIPPGSSLMAVSGSGALRWELTLPGSQYTPRLALLANGTLWVSLGQYLHHVTTAGRLLETIELVTDAASALAVADDGTMYVMTYDGRLLALDGDSPLDPGSPWPTWRRDNRRTASVPH